LFKSIDPKLLIDYSKNAKNHPKEQLEKLARSFKEEGFHGAIIVDENNVIIAGHGRKHAAILAGLESVPIQVLDGLTEEQKRSKRLGDNKLAESDWLDNFLKEELTFLKESNYDLSLTGFNLNFLNPVLDSKVEEDNNSLSEPKQIECPNCGHEFYK
jgi:ParB family transcriptional regulator, chromosome partitioning protein